MEIKCIQSRVIGELANIAEILKSVQLEVHASSNNIKINCILIRGYQEGDSSASTNDFIGDN